MSDSRLVYSTEHGDRRRAAAAPEEVRGDGIVRVSREVGGRRGKTVTVVRGLAGAELATVASDLKRLCGSGGTVKNGTLELQGDHRDKVVARLESLGHAVKRAGG